MDAVHQVVTQPVAVIDPLHRPLVVPHLATRKRREIDVDIQGAQEGLFLWSLGFSAISYLPETVAGDVDHGAVAGARHGAAAVAAAAAALSSAL